MFELELSIITKHKRACHVRHARQHIHDFNNQTQANVPRQA